ncbi:MAG: adenylyltransferase/cytidyltransferase family protein [Bacteroidales bacterium]|nr:adenylyltransferase/cytidyltransferase family protein [Bacteroidales bacterium]MBN2819955.1 adenylyltransferase/cytidyltransferase family protein [Bacteroidales bacterium]
MKKVFVSGCYDMLHSGHVAFFKEASQYGDLYVGIGSDATIESLKGRSTINSEDERLYMVKSIKYITDAWVNRGDGIIDFRKEIENLKPDIFIVNKDGHSPVKENLCKELGIKYTVLERVPEAGLPARSTTLLRKENKNLLPYRIDIAGTWIDQPYVNKVYPGSCMTLSIEPSIEFNERSGMATSTRKRAFDLWGPTLPLGNPVKLAQTLFRFDNEPGKIEISGSQDSIGIAIPGLCFFTFEANQYWPSGIQIIEDEETLTWLEEHIYLVTLWPRKRGYEATANASITPENVKRLTNAAGQCFESIKKKDLKGFGKYMVDSFNAQTAIFPSTLDKDIEQVIDKYKNDILGWKLSGAGGGGYLIMVSEKPVENAFKIKARRRSGY